VVLIQVTDRWDQAPNAVISFAGNAWGHGQNIVEAVEDLLPPACFLSAFVCGEYAAW
jgi:hypothetical protein